jgi:glycosyltransferase involved in cell wall biosynthesis
MTTISSDHAKCTVIIPTLATADRADSLKRAIRSAGQGNCIKPKIIVLVNGRHYCEHLLSELKESSEAHLIRSSASSLAEALLAGRREVSTPFFSFLDDDDEYLPGAIDARLAILEASPEISVVVTNGFRHVQGQDQLAMQNLPNIPQDPLYALFQENWLASCGGLFRTRNVPVDTFLDIHHLREWTWIAFRLASEEFKIASLDIPTFRIHDTPASASKSEKYLLSQVGLYQRMLSMPPRPDIARIIRRRLPQAWHDVSSHHMEKGALDLAWTSHLKSLRHPAGWKYLSYTRKLLMPKAGSHA